MKVQNNITGNIYSDEWYTSREFAALCYEILKPAENSTILCPFDSAKSNFVKIGLELGHKVIYGIQDFLENDYEYDYLITNPPFSIKDSVIEKVLQRGKPATLVLPLDSLGGVKRHSLFKAYGYPEIFMPTRRVHYFDENWQKRTNCNFHSVILTFNRGTGITWE